MESMAFAFPMKPGKAQEWRERAATSTWLSAAAGVSRSIACISNTRRRGDLAVLCLEGHDLQRAFQYLRTVQDPFAAWLQQHTLDLFEGFDLTNHHWKRSPPWPLMHRAWKRMKRGTAP